MKNIKDKQAFAQLGAVVALLVAIIIGVMVFYSINESISMDTAGGTHEYMTGWNSSNSTASTVFTLLPIVAIVIIAGVILGVVTRFGGGGV